MEMVSVNPAYRTLAASAGRTTMPGGTPDTGVKRSGDAPETGPTARSDPSVATESASDRVLRVLKQRDREVRAHEQAHLSAAGRFALGGAGFEYQRGPDGRLYAVGGDVQIDTSPVPGDPRATLEKAETVRRAALAPSEPSAQDRRVAAQASRMAAAASAEIRQAERSGQATATGDTEETGATRLERRLVNSGAVSLESESMEQLDLLV